MSQRASPSTPNYVSDLTAPKPEQVRLSRDRADELKQYIQGLLPSHLHAKVDVVISKQVNTAAVMPATEDALIHDEQSDFDRQQAKRLIEQVDGDYLVLITGREAPTDSVCLNDQLTADTAHQFGLGLHETLHILKTAFSAVQKILEEEVKEPYKEFVHELINIAEDGAIENEAKTGDDFTDRAGNRLTLIRQIHSRSAEEYEDLPESKRQFTFGDALLKALHDKIIYDTQVTDILLDESNDLITFASDDEREVFLEIYDEIEALRDDILSTRGDEDTDLFKNDKKASVRRAKRVVQFWHDVLKPIVDKNTGHQQNGSQQAGQPHNSGEAQQDSSAPEQQNQTDPQQSAEPKQQESGPNSSTADNDLPASTEDSPTDKDKSTEGNSQYGCPECDDAFDTDHGRRVHYGQQHGDVDDLEEQLDETSKSDSGGEPTENDTHTGNTDNSNGQTNSQPEIDPDSISLDTEAFDNPLQDIDSHPSIGDEPHPDEVQLQPQPTQQNSTDSQTETGDQYSEQASSNASGTDPSGTSGGTAQDAGSEESKPPNDNGWGGTEGSDKTSADSDQENTSGGSGTHESTSETKEGAANQSDQSAANNRGSSTVEVNTKSSTSDLASHTNTDNTQSSNSSQQATFGDFTDTAPDTDTSNSGTQSETEAELSSTTPETEDTSQATSQAPQQSRQEADPTTEGDSITESKTPSDGQQDASDGLGNETSEGLDFDPSKESQEQSSSESNETGQSSENEIASTVTDQSPTHDQSAIGESDAGSESHQPESKDLNENDVVSAGDGNDDSDSASRPTHQDDLETSDFESDRRRAKRTAENSTIDEQGLADDLQSLEGALGEERESKSEGNGGGGNDAGPGPLGELTILPDPESEDEILGIDWADIEKSAGTAADTLAKQLRLDQQTLERHGLTAGTTVNTKTAYRLGYNDPRTFTESIPGDEKEYFVVIVLDRSGSMGPSRYHQPSDDPPKIEIATGAVARFAVACEDLDIDVAIIDFYDEEARYVKPPSVETEYAKERILNIEAAGGTPLADALSLARTVADSDSKESIIISITDDRPANVDEVKEQIKRSYAPICSLTIATDREYGNPPPKAKKLEPVYSQTTTVYDPAKLDDRIDELASLLSGY